jgi:ABC-type antimicrobial peptide transport system permease subunit
MLGTVGIFLGILVFLGLNLYIHLFTIVAVVFHHFTNSDSVLITLIITLIVLIVAVVIQYHHQSPIYYHYHLKITNYGLRDEPPSMI